MLLRDLNISVNGRRDSTSPYVGVRADQIPTGFPLPAFLLNDVDAGFPNRLYSVEILTLPSAGVLYLDKAGAGTFTGAPDGTYAGTQRVEKFDPDVGRISTTDTTYSLQVGTPADVTAPQMTGAITVSGITQIGFTIAWPAATDNVAVSGYGYSLNNGTSYTPVAGLTVSPTGLTAGTVYPVKVRAYDAAGNASAPLSTSVTTTAAAPPADTTPPQFSGSLTASLATTGGFTLTWPAATDAVGVTGYEVSLDGGTSYVGVGNITSKAYTGLAPNTTYPARVRSFDAAGNKSAALAANAVTLAMPSTRTVSLVLGEIPGPAANLTDIMVSYHAAPGPHATGTALYQSASETTDASGLLSFTVDGSAIASGASGLLAVLLPDGRHYLGLVPAV